MRHMYRLVLALVLSLLAWAALAGATPPAPPQGGDLLTLSVVVKDPRGRDIRDVELEVLVAGRPVKPVGLPEGLTTSKQGNSVAEFLLPRGALPGAPVAVQAQKPNWQSLPPTLVRVVAAGVDRAGCRRFQATQTVTLHRRVTPAFWIVVLVLLGVYGAIVLDVLHRTLAAILGASLLLFVSYTAGTFYPDYFVLSFAEAVEAIDFNVVFLLLGMMLIVGVLKKTGIFPWLALQAYSLARGHVVLVVCLFMVITAVASAFVDNLTTMLLMFPVTLEIAAVLKIHPIALLIPEVFAANVGGTATLIGDPPNILIGSYANLGFLDFVRNLTGVSVVCLAASVVFFFVWYRKYYRWSWDKDLKRTLAFLRHEYRITDKKLLTKAAILLSLTLVALLVHHLFTMKPAIPVLAGALLLLAVSRLDMVELLEKEVEWSTLVFLIGLFMVLAGTETTGILDFLAREVAVFSGHSLTKAVLLVLWVSALVSAFVETTPFTAVMLPVVAHLSSTVPGAESGVLWWALALGSCLGGNGSLIGSSANVITVGLAEKAGYRISFLEYMRACWWPMLITVAIGMIYLFLFSMPR